MCALEEICADGRELFTKKRHPPSKTFCAAEDRKARDTTARNRAGNPAEGADIVLFFKEAD
jgi:hypothetical protein